MKSLSSLSTPDSQPVRAGILVERYSPNGASFVRSGIVNGQKEDVAPTGLDLFAGGDSTNRPHLRRFGVRGHVRALKAATCRRTPKQLFLLLCFCILHSAFCLRATGQTYSVDWFTVAGGGGTSTGSIYSVSGTFGQPDAGQPMAGSGYSVTSGFWSLYAPVGPVLVTTPPTNTLAVAGSSPVLSVTLSGTPPFSLQWYFNGTPLSNATNATLTLTNFAATNAGSYTLAVSNAAGGVVSASFVVSLLTFSVDWFVVAGGGGTSTGGIYTVSGTFGQSDAGAEMQGGGYAVDGGFWSLFAVEVPVLPAFVASPTNMNVEAGNGTVLSVTASGTQPLTYQWYFDGTALSNATNATLALTNFLAGSVGTYQVAVSNAAGGILSTQFTVNFPVYSVDWFKVAGGGGTSTGGVYTVNGTFGQQDAGGPMQGNGYSVEVGFWSPLDLQTFSLTGNAPLITSQPQSLNFSNGMAQAFGISVTGTPPLFYQWQENGVNLTDSGNLSGSTTSNLVWSATTPNYAGLNNNYAIIIENAYGSVTSSIVSFTGIVPVIFHQPCSLILSNGSPASFSATVLGTQPLTYQWQKNGTNLTDVGNIYGTLTTNLSLNTTTTNDAGSYTVIITNLYGAVTSGVAKLTMILPSSPYVETLLTFDDLAPPGYYYANITGYGGLNWNNFGVVNGAYYTGFNLNGFYAGIVSGNFVAYNGNGSPAYFYSNKPFNLISAYLTAVYNQNLQVSVSGIGGSGYTTNLVLSEAGPTLVNFNYNGVSEVYFSSSGGTPGLYIGSGEGFAMDNLLISVGGETTNFPPNIQSAISSGGSINLSWTTLNSVPPLTYQLQYCTNLASPNWINLGGVLTNTITSLSVSDSTSTDAQRFYRVLLVQ
jgi:Immunoglobulin I-set domain/Immunoglobulin domain